MRKKFIAGIYNYCDRWCERCTYTTRCRSFENTSKLSPEQLDINNKAFWDNISASFAKAIKLLRKAAEKHGIDIDQPMTKEESEVYEKNEALIEKTAKNHKLSRLCRKYQKLVMPFTENNNGVTERVTELEGHLFIGITTQEKAVKEVADISDCLEIIQWYLFFVEAKLQRALHGKLEGEDWEQDNGYAKDSDGSAKIAIIAIERSIQAWVKLFEMMPTIEDTALDALTCLNQLRENALEEFPNAMEFKRPGFDD